MLVGRYAILGCIAIEQRNGKDGNKQPREEVKDRTAEQLLLQSYLLGSYAYGTPGPESDYDRYVVIEDAQTDWHAQTVRA